MDRGSGILLHITSLPSAHGVGDFGKQAYIFADYLSNCRQSNWQILPLNPTSASTFHSPYSSSSVFAINPLFIDLDNLAGGCRLADKKYSEHCLDAKQVDYRKALSIKNSFIDKAFSSFSPKSDSDFNDFCDQNCWWLEDYCLFTAIKSKKCSRPWTSWPPDLRDRKKTALDSISKTFSMEIMKEKFIQHILFKQWKSLKKYCNLKGIKIIGDMPIYPCLDSAEVWANPDIFKLGRDKKPLYLAGVPPDYFSQSGQLWGNPVYDWDRLMDSGYEWWARRLSLSFKLFDITRIDHFRGLVAYWEVPFGNKDATGGKWVKAPSCNFLDSMVSRFGSLPVIAEDLGHITDDVKQVLKKYNFPTMKVLIFAFSQDNHPYMPHNYDQNCYAYTGTHDNDTAAGWFAAKAGEDEKRRLEQYIGKNINEKNIHWELIRLAMSSVSAVSVIPMQDILGLGNEARMNLPSTIKGNWKWQLNSFWLDNKNIADRLSQLTEIYGRNSS